MSLTQREFHRILLIKPSSLGDVVHALPVAHGLRRRYPRARIDWLVARPFAPLLEDHPDIDRVVLFDRARLGQAWWNPAATGALLGFLRTLRRARYDLVIDLQGLFRSGFFARTTGADVRIGPASPREGAGLFHTHRIVAPDAPAHAVDRNYAVSRLLGFADLPPSFILPERAEPAARARALLAEHGIPVARPCVVWAPAARGEIKQWPAARFSRAIDALSLEISASSLVVGGPSERRRCAEVRAGCTTPVADLSGATGLRELVELLRGAALVVAHDSGVTHLAAALDRPLVCICGPTDPRRTGPYRRIGDVVRLPLPCSPCLLRELSACPHSHRCMNDLSVDEVLAACRSRVVPLPLSSS